jgi:hypothetical protein
MKHPIIATLSGVLALDAVLAGKEGPNASNKPYGCGVKY